MLSPSTRRRFAVLLLAVFLLSALPLFAAPGAATSAPAARAPWDALARLWDALTAVWAEGCSSDPFGGCRDSNATSESPDNGCWMDPFGGCADASTSVEPAESPDNGCWMDPYGGCRTGS